MAQIQQQAAVNLATDLQTYLNNNRGNLTSEQIAQIVNQYLTGNDKLAAQGGSISTGIYKRFGEFDYVTNKIEVVTTGLWSGDTGSLTTVYTSSAQVAGASGDYYYNVYNTEETSSVQFAVAYGHRLGLGSVSLENDDNSTIPTKATYAQYKQILLEQDDTQFTFLSSSAAGTHDSDAIYVINVARARYKEKMDAGNWSLALSGSNGVHYFIDDSGKKFDDTVGKAGRVFNVVSGSLNIGTENAATIEASTDSNGQGFGLFYPDQGLIILNPSALSDVVGSVPSGDLVGSDSVTVEQENHKLLWESIQLGTGATTNPGFEARRTENVSTSHYFVRATNREFNYSNNPSYVTGSDGSFAESTFVNDPRTFITTVGLYSDANELIAVAKTSQPIAKSFDKEVLIKVKLDF
jgi:hypothetical protein